MKAVMMLGSIVGFLIGAGFALAGNSSWPAALWRACAAALAAAVLARWWSGVWLKSLNNALQNRRPHHAAPPTSPKTASKP